MPSVLRSDMVTPRAYQENIVREAVEKNTLVVLPTGLGKTLISALVSAELLDRCPDMKVLMMAPTRPLVMQHRESFLEVLDLDKEELVVMTGHVPPPAREEIWQEGRIFFTTPQIVENDIENGRLSLDDFSLVVFDEAHRAVKDYAYTSIAKHYMKVGNYPIILGLTASPGGSRARVVEVSENLSIEKLIYRTHEDDDVSPYVHEIETNWREVDLPAQYRTILDLLGRMLDTRVKKLRAHQALDGAYVGKKQLLALGQRLRERLQHAGGSERGLIFASMVLQSSTLSILHAMELLESQGIRNLFRFLNKIEDGKDDKRAYKNIVKDPHFIEMKKMVIEHIEVEHPKVEELKLEVIRQISRSPRSKVLVFTQYRDTASLLVKSLKNDVFVVERFVGQASKLGDEGLNQEEQHKVLERFRKGDITVLVATSVAEEGLDIPEVDLVVFYEPIPSEIRFIQRKGRTGRKGLGRLEILAARDSIDTAYYFASQRKIKKMKEIMSSIDTTLKRVHRGKRPKPGRALKKASRPPKEKARVKTSKRPKAERKRPPTENELVRDWLVDTLEKSDRVYIEDIFEEGSLNGLDRRLLKKALEALLSEGMAFKPSWDVVQKVGKRTKKDKGVLDVKVVKVFPGGARLELDDGTIMTLFPEEFPGNPSLIKKGRAIRVKGEIYESNGKKHLRVTDVLE